MNNIISPLFRSLTSQTCILILCMVSFSALKATPPDANNMATEMGAIAYISDSERKDAIYVKDAEMNNVIYTCSFENEIILTPSVSSNGKYLTFLVDTGRNQKTIHILGPIQKQNNRWQADDLELMTVRGGGWPAFRDSQSVYLSMPAQTSLSNDGTSHIYLVSGEGIEQISNNLGQASHIWPLVNPENATLIYRHIPQPDDMGFTTEPVKSVIFNPETGSSEMHLVNQFVFLEQWINQTEILFSYRDKDEHGNRIYALYNTETGATSEIYRNKSRQGAITDDSKFLATIRLVPEGSPYFDIFVTDLISNTEINLTQSPKQSESLIGWIK